MKQNSQIEIKKLLDFQEGKLSEAAFRQMKRALETDKEARELLEGIELLYAQEDMNRAALESFFENVANDFDNKLKDTAVRRVQRQSNLLQLRQIAAIFLLLGASVFLLSSCNYFENSNEPDTEIVGPYDLAYGMKVSF